MQFCINPTFPATYRFLVRMYKLCKVIRAAYKNWPTTKKKDHYSRQTTAQIEIGEHINGLRILLFNPMFSK